MTKVDPIEISSQKNPNFKSLIIKEDEFIDNEDILNSSKGAKDSITLFGKMKKNLYINTSSAEYSPKEIVKKNIKTHIAIPLDLLKKRRSDGISNSQSIKQTPYKILGPFTPSKSIEKITLEVNSNIKTILPSNKQNNVQEKNQKKVLSNIVSNFKQKKQTVIKLNSPNNESNLKKKLNYIKNVIKSKSPSSHQQTNKAYMRANIASLDLSGKYPGSQDQLIKPSFTKCNKHINVRYLI